MTGVRKEDRNSDKGCEAATTHLGSQSNCLQCPFAKCVYDERGGQKYYLRQQRNKEIVRLFFAGNKGVGELAQIFGVSERTIQRVLSKGE